MDIFIKAAAISAVGAILALLIKKENPETALLLTIAAGCIILYFAFDIITNIIDFAENLADTTGLSSAVISIVVKTTGIAILTKLSSDVCRDAGQQSLASAVELTGSAAALYIALPLMKTVFSMIDKVCK